jgi:pyridoxamine 5'-phosphate oxidase
MQETVIINQIHYNLEKLLQDCWHRLMNGASSAKHPFHCPAIATINGTFPEMRTVVLRKVIPAEKMLIFHTDYRSPKVAKLKRTAPFRGYFTMQSRGFNSG